MASADSVGRGVIVAVSCGCEVGVALCKGVAFTVGDGSNSRTGLAVVGGLARRDGAVGETVAAAAGILGDEGDGTCRDDADGRATGACVGEAAGDANAGLEIGGEV